MFTVIPAACAAKCTMVALTISNPPPRPATNNFGDFTSPISYTCLDRNESIDYLYNYKLAVGHDNTQLIPSLKG
jgi:hypothetical protein